MHGNGNIPTQNNHVGSLVTALTRRMNSQYNRGLRTKLFVLLRTALEWKFYTYLNESALLATQKLRESVSQFGEYKLCIDIPEEWRAETPSTRLQISNVHETGYFSHFYYGSQCPLHEACMQRIQKQSQLLLRTQRSRIIIKNK